MFIRRLFLTGIGALALIGTPVGADEATEVPFEEGKRPPISEPGEMCCLVQKPAVLKKVTETVQVSPATFYYEEVPAQYELKDESVLIREAQKRATEHAAVLADKEVQQMVQEAYTELRVIPATFETVEQEVEIIPARTEEVYIPATFKKVTETIQVAPEHVRMVSADCGKNCYAVVKDEARSETIEKYVVDQPAKVETRTIPAVKRTIRVRKVKEPARVEKEEIPAQYEPLKTKVVAEPQKLTYEEIPAVYTTVKKEVETVPASQKKVELPAKTETLNKTIVEKPAQLVWRKYSKQANPVNKYGSVPGSPAE